LGGVSLEFTGELNEEGFSVTECVGGSMELDEAELGLRYQVGIFFLCWVVLVGPFGFGHRFFVVPFFYLLFRPIFGWETSYLVLRRCADLFYFILQSFCDPRLNFEQSLGKVPSSIPYLCLNLST
jgi:Class-II DAHP synthetase family